MFEPQIGQPLPQSPDAERAVLGSILTNANAFYRVIGIIGAEDFFKDAHRTIFNAMRKLAEESREIDILTVKEELAKHGVMEQADGGAYVSSLMDAPPDITNVERYAEIVKEKSELRRLIVLGNSMMRAALDHGADHNEIKTESMAQLVGGSTHNGAARPMWDVSVDVAERRRQQIAGGMEHVIRTGTFPMLDMNMVFRRKRLHLVCGPSSHGKSTFMRCLLVSMIRASARLKGSYISLEESDEDVLKPLLSYMSGVLLDRIHDGTLNDVDQHHFDAAVDELHKWRERFCFSDRQRSFDEIYADCRRLKATTGLDVVFVDYLQLVSGFEDATRSGEQQVNRIGRGLLRMAQDLDIAVIAGSQVNKEREKRSSGRLSLGDTAYAKVLGEHAGAVLMFQCPRQDDPSNSDIKWCATTFQIAKNRGRRKCDVPMHADMPTQRFGEGDCAANNCRWTPKEQQQLTIR